VTLEDKHLELIIRPISFVQVTQDLSCNPLIPGEAFPLERLERINWSRALNNWKKKGLLREWEPKIFYKPLLFGLTKGALQNASFLSAASFQETSRVLSQASVRGQIDYLHGLKENLILGIRLPIGTNANFLISRDKSIDKIILKWKNQHVLEKIIVIIQKENRFIWIDALCYLERNPLFFEKDCFKLSKNLLSKNT
jgi:hypothetical protein